MISTYKKYYIRASPTLTCRRPKMVSLIFGEAGDSLLNPGHFKDEMNVTSKKETSCKNKTTQNNLYKKKKINPTTAGLEPTKEFPSRFLVYRLNHSARSPHFD